MDILSLKTFLKGMKKDRLVVVIVLMVIAISLFYPVMQKLFSIDKKVSVIVVRVDELNRRVDDIHILDTTRYVTWEKNQIFMNAICKKIDGVYSIGMTAIERMNHNLTRELSTVQKGNTSLLEALRQLQRDNEEQLRQMRYLDSLRKKFWEQDFSIGVKPIKMTLQ